MELVIDASIVFTAIIGKGVTKDIIFSTAVTLYAPEFLFEEIAEHMARIEKLSGISANDFDTLIEKLKSAIKAVPKEKFEKFLKGAREIVSAIASAEDDVEYIALSMSMNDVPIWSNDGHFKKHSAIKAFNTAELVAHLKSSGTLFS